VRFPNPGGIMKIWTVLFFLTLLYAPAYSQIGSPCGVPVLLQPTPLNAQATLNPFNGSPIILLNPQFVMMAGQAGVRFALAHECAHHQLNHVAISLQVLQSNPYVMPWITPQIELAADCQAGAFLGSVGDMQAIQAGLQFVGGAGPFPSGPNYPTGFQRMQAIRTGAQMGHC